MPELFTLPTKQFKKQFPLLDDESPREKDFVMALSERYSAEIMEDRTPLDQAYSDAMRNLVNTCILMILMQQQCMQNRLWIFIPGIIG